MSRTVSLAADERARVPFAVVGVLLLVSSLVLATTLRPDPAPENTDVERAMAELTAASGTAVRIVPRWAVSARILRCPGAVTPPPRRVVPGDAARDRTVCLI